MSRILRRNAETKKPLRKPQKALDRVSGKRPRGRPGVRVSEIVGRANNYRRIFWKYRLDKRKKEWVQVRPQKWVRRLLAAKTEGGVRRALDSASSYAQNEFSGLVPLILTVLRAKKFPKTGPAQLDHLADSLAGRGRVSPRRSRDICGKERTRERAKSPYKIIRKEFYIECSCGYRGPAREDACRKCGAQIPVSLEHPGLFYFGRAGSSCGPVEVTMIPVPAQF